MLLRRLTITVWVLMSTLILGPITIPKWDDVVLPPLLSLNDLVPLRCASVVTMGKRDSSSKFLPELQQAGISPVGRSSNRSTNGAAMMPHAVRNVVCATQHRLSASLTAYTLALYKVLGFSPESVTLLPLTGCSPWP